jgi:hypothetical protein
MQNVVVVVLATVLLALTVPVAEGATGFGKKKKPIQEIHREDLPHIGCSVCKNAVTEVFKIVNERREKAPYKKLDENHIVEVLDNICDPEGTEGSWIRYYDIVEEKENGRRYLELETPGGMGKCKKECHTIARSCYDLFEEEIDRDDLSPVLWRNTIKTAGELQDKVCKKMSQRCSDKRVTTNKVLAGSAKRKDEDFEPVTDKVRRCVCRVRCGVMWVVQPLSAVHSPSCSCTLARTVARGRRTHPSCPVLQPHPQDLEMEKMMKDMEKTGLGGSIYSRDDMAGMQVRMQREQEGAAIQCYRFVWGAGTGTDSMRVFPFSLSLGGAGHDGRHDGRLHGRGRNDGEDGSHGHGRRCDPWAQRKQRFADKTAC